MLPVASLRSTSRCEFVQEPAGRSVEHQQQPTAITRRHASAVRRQFQIQQAPQTMLKNLLNARPRVRLKSQAMRVPVLDVLRNLPDRLGSVSQFPLRQMPGRRRVRKLSQTNLGKVLLFQGVRSILLRLLTSLGCDLSEATKRGSFQLGIFRLGCESNWSWRKRRPLRS